MSSLLTLSPQSREVTIGRRTRCNVFGWSAEAIADLLASYANEIQGVVTQFQGSLRPRSEFQQIITGADTAVLDTLSQRVIPTAVVWATRLPRNKFRRYPSRPRL